ncbi:MAG: hypothetical protein KDA52_06095 [Planctomycetaceae bacterium]|nr:hypothetical protein [Planctomycetaceae bacterium]
MTTREQLQSFQAFAEEQLDKHQDHLSLDELYGLWRVSHPAHEELLESVNALNLAYADLTAGHTGEPAREALRESCEQLGVVIGS